MFSARFPPCTVSVPPFKASVCAVVLVPTPLASESECNTRFNLLKVDEMPALMLMLLWADSVRTASPPAVLLIAFETVISPFCALVPALPVVIVTLMPLLRADCIVATVMMAESLVVEIVAGGVPLTLVSDPKFRIVTLFGSSSHKPPLPLGALASATCVTSSICLPEVSIWPPSPPSTPPRAAIFP